MAAPDIRMCPGRKTAPMSIRIEMAASAVGLAVWFQQIQSVAHPTEWGTKAGIAGFLTYLVLAMPQVTRTTWNVVLACTVIIVAAFFSGCDWHVIPEALRTVLLFMGFFPAITLINVVFRQSGALDGIASTVSHMPAGHRRSASLIAAHAIGSVMSIGALATVALLFDQIDNTTERKESGVFVLRGVGLAFFWTPFTVGMGFATTHVPEVPLWMGICAGLVAAFMALCLSLREWRLTRILPAFALVRSIALPIFLAAVGLILINLATGLSGMRAIILLTPLVVSLWLAWQPSSVRTAACRRVWAEVGALGNTMWLFAASITMGVVLSETPAFLSALHRSGLASLSSPLIFAIIAFLSILLAILGFHPTVIGSIVVALTAVVGEQLEPLTVFLLILFGWHCGVILSFSSLSVAVVQREFDIPFRSLILGQNLRFTLAFGGLLTIVYAIIHTLLALT